MRGDVACQAWRQSHSAASVALRRAVASWQGRATRACMFAWSSVLERARQRMLAARQRWSLTHRCAVGFRVFDRVWGLGFRQRWSGR
jgi:hypothetical protein